MSYKRNKTAKQRAEDIRTQQMLKNWNRVSCYYCGKRISIERAETVKENGMEYFACPSCSEEFNY